MKKLLLLAAFGLLASPAFAQNSSTDIEQTGNNHRAEVDQLDAGSHVADIDQYGGNENKAFLTQGGQSDSYGIESTILQVGSRNKARTTLSRGTGNETDPNATSLQIQQGNHNDAFINQNAFGQSAGGGDNGRDFEQEQYGNRNDALSNGTGASMTDQYQAGNDNDAIIDGLLKSSTIIQIQDGNRNDAEFVGAGYGFSTFTQEQYGNDNVSEVIGLGHTQGGGETGFTYQDGNDNRIWVDDTGSAKGNIIEATQLSNSNRATVTYTTGENTTTLFQSGNENTVIVNQ